MLRQSLVLCAALVSAVFASGRELVYRKSSGKEVTTYTVRISPVQAGSAVTTRTPTPNGDIVEDATVDKRFSTLRWQYSNPVERIDVSLTNSGSVIDVKGTERGKPLERRFEVKHPLRQMFPLDLIPMVTESRDTLLLQAMALFGPGAFKLGTMRAIKVGEGPVRVNGASIDAVKVRIALTGLLANVWHAHYWLRKSDGIPVRGEGVEKPGSPPVITELISEK